MGDARKDIPYSEETLNKMRAIAADVEASMAYLETLAQGTSSSFNTTATQIHQDAIVRIRAQQQPSDALPTVIKNALAGKRKGLLLCELLWSDREQFVEWDTIGAQVWLNRKEDIGNMQKAVARLNDDLCIIQGNSYRAESFKSSGARIFRATNDGQS